MSSNDNILYTIPTLSLKELFDNNTLDIKAKHDFLKLVPHASNYVISSRK
jgi:hypothetical protein